jgi:hypothetical protein
MYLQKLDQLREGLLGIWRELVLDLYDTVLDWEGVATTKKRLTIAHDDVEVYSVIGWADMMVREKGLEASERATSVPIMRRAR